MCKLVRHLMNRAATWLNRLTCNHRWAYYPVGERVRVCQKCGHRTHDDGAAGW